MPSPDRASHVTLREGCGWPVLAALVLASGAVLAQEISQTPSDKGVAHKGALVQKGEQDLDPNLAARVKDYVSKQLWKSRISALPTGTERAGQDDLNQLIGRLKTAEVKVRAKAKDRTPEVRPAPAAEPNAARAGQTEAAAAQKAAAKAPPAEARGPASGMAGMPESMDPNGVADPFKMAEILYASGLASKAAPFYQRALALSDAQDKKQASQRQWILLQLGRCWREAQPGQARQMFSQLISEYPDSPWIDVARAWQGLTDWYLTEQPRLAIQRSASPGSQAAAKPQPAAQP